MPDTSNRTTRSISCAGDEIFFQALKRLAGDRGIPMGLLVRNAIQRVEGDAINAKIQQLESASHDSQYIGA